MFNIPRLSKRVLSFSLLVVGTSICFAQAPQVTLTPSTLNPGVGQAIAFTVSTHCDSGLGQIGLELCNSGGTPTLNLGLLGVSGNDAATTINWTPPSAGTYYFDGYGWNAAFSLLTRTPVLTITVGTSAPQVSLTPSTTTPQVGQAVTFTVNAHSDSGLGQVGLELCDAAGTPTSNLGLVTVSGADTSKTFTWIPPGTGTYYFDGYGWNAAFSLLKRTAVLALTVGAPPPQVTVTPSSTAATVGQPISFTVSSHCDAGLNEIGLELCNAGGVPTANLGLQGVSGNNVSTTFTWIPPGVGTYYFDGYGWNSMRTQLTRTALTTVIISPAVTLGRINIPTAISYGASGDTQTVSFSINDSGTVSSSFSCTKNQTYPGCGASSFFPNPQQELLFTLSNLRAGPGYVLWEIEDQVEHFGSLTPAAYTERYTHLFGAFYQRSTRSWQIRDLGMYRGGGAYQAFPYSYQILSITSNLASVTWTVVTSYYTTAPQVTTNYTYTIPQQAL